MSTPGSMGSAIRLPPAVRQRARDVAHALEPRALCATVHDEALEHRHPVTAADHLRVHADGQDPAAHVLVHPVELTGADLKHLARRRAALAVRLEVELEVRPVVELEAHLQLPES